MRGGLACKGVLPGRGEVGEGDEDEVAHVHARVRQGQLRIVYNPVIYGNKVDVNRAVDILPIGVAVWRRVYAGLYAL